MPVKGIERVKRNYRALMKDIGEKRTEQGVVAVMLQGGSMAATMTPMDTSTLLNSHFVSVETKPGKVVGRTGYGAAYAAAVHNAPGTLQGLPRPPVNGRNSRGNYWDPGGEPGFLRKGFEEIKPSIPDILKKAYKI